MTLALLGIDFTSAPSKRKPITVARGTLAGARLSLQRIQVLTRLEDFEAVLSEPGPWLGGFDFPFGLPREFARTLTEQDDAVALMDALRRRCASRMAFRELVDAWGNARPAGQRLIHRTTDRAVEPGSTSPLQTRYVPVGFMYYEGFARLLDAGVHLPGLREGDPGRIALEVYPARLAHELIGRRSYKNGSDADRLIARKDILHALEVGRTRAGVRVVASPALQGEIAADAQGDLLDALLCLVQAAWASTQPAYGVPADADRVEGWIVGP